MDSYLSIDLDYFTSLTYYDTFCYNPTKNYHSFFARLFNKGIPILLVDSHENLLPHVNSNPASVLINMDYHNDVFPVLKEDIKKGLNSVDCASWCNHVDWRKEGTFTWCLPNYQECWIEGWGDCNLNLGPTALPRVFSKKKPSQEVASDFLWGNYKIYKGLPKLSNVKAAGICLSRDFVNPGDLNSLSDIFTEAHTSGKLYLGVDVSSEDFFTYFSGCEEAYNLKPRRF